MFKYILVHTCYFILHIVSHSPLLNDYHCRFDYHRISAHASSPAHHDKKAVKHAGGLQEFLKWQSNAVPSLIKDQSTAGKVYKGLGPALSEQLCRTAYLGSPKAGQRNMNYSSPYLRNLSGLVPVYIHI